MLGDCSHVINPIMRNWSYKQKAKVDATYDPYLIMKYRYTHTTTYGRFRLHCMTELLNRENQERILFGMDILFHYMHATIVFIRTEFERMRIPAFNLVEPYHRDQTTIFAMNHVSSLEALYHIARTNLTLWNEYCSRTPVPMWNEYNELIKRYDSIELPPTNTNIERVCLTLAYIALDVPEISDVQIYKYANDVLHSYYHHLFKLRQGMNSRGDLGFIRCLRKQNFIEHIQFEDI